IPAQGQRLVRDRLQGQGREARREIRRRQGRREERSERRSEKRGERRGEARSEKRDEGRVEIRSSAQGRMSTLRRYLVAGLLVWIPLVITLWVLKLLVDVMDQSLLLLPETYRSEALFGFHV